MTTPRISLAAARLRPMAPVDVAWLRMEHPTNLMMVTALLSFDGMLTLDELRALSEQRLLRFRRFRERVIERRRVGRRCFWEIDPHFDLSSHVRRVALPAPGDETSLRELVSQLMSTPLDSTKPLWQIHLIESFVGVSALLIRIHHCIGDGAALMNVLLGMTDDAARAAAPPGGESQRGFLRTTAARLRRDLDLLVHPTFLLELARSGGTGAMATVRLLLRSRDPRTALKGKLGVSKRAAWSESLALSDVKEIGRVTGSTVNDVLLSALAGALGRYLKARGDSVRERNIRAAVPVDLRRPDEPPTLGNRFGLVFVSLPVGITDPLERLFTVRRRMRELKASPEAATVLKILGALGRTTAQTQQRLVGLIGGKTSAVITNVPGPRDRLSIGGVPVRSMMFWVPMTGRVGVGISILSYADRVRLGIASDAGLVPDPETIAAVFQREFEQLFRLTRIPLEADAPLPV